MTDTPETLLARLTPPGKAAIATLGLVGPAAWTVVQGLLRRPGDRTLPEQPAAGAIYYGRLGDTSEGTDEVVVYVRSIAPEPVVEVHGHGGRAVLRLMEQRFEARGVHSVPSADWSRRLFGEDEAAVRHTLARCPTVRTAAVALDYLNGSFVRALEALADDLDHQRTDAVESRLRRLEELLPVGSHLDVPWKVALAGAPNVGKSSLANALAGYTRSLVSDVPGTTRDVVTTMLAVDGWPVELADTAGLRVAQEPLEAEGVGRARQFLSDADLVLWILDGSEPPVLPDTDLPRSRHVINKVDRPPAWEWSRAPGAVHVSALTGQGIAELCGSIAKSLVADPPRPGEAVAVTAGAQATVRALREALSRGRLQEAEQTVEEFRRRVSRAG